MKLHLKFQADTSADAVEDVIRQAHAAGAEAVRPLFPNAKNTLLGRLYTIDVDTPAIAKKINGLLGNLDCVERVESEVKRSLR
jgi:hypothetical protein